MQDPRTNDRTNKGTEERTTGATLSFTTINININKLLLSDCLLAREAGLSVRLFFFLRTPPKRSKHVTEGAARPSAPADLEPPEGLPDGSGFGLLLIVRVGVHGV